MPGMSERVIAFVVYPELTVLDLIGPLQVLKALEGTGAVRAVTVGERVEPMATDCGLRIQPEATFADVPRPFGILVPGGLVGPFKAMVNDSLMDYVKSSAETASWVSSVCTGSLVLGAAGLLEGKRATTHFTCMELLAKLGAIPVRERWVEDGKIITSAGVSAGIDMALAFAARLAGEGAARIAQTVLEYDPKPPFGGLDFEKVDMGAIAAMMAGATWAIG
jgi:transcriptional regulator GlxA family with amidase domain